MTSELLRSYFLGKLLVINCQLNTFTLKSVTRSWSLFEETVKFHGLFHLYFNQQIPRLGAKFSELQKNCGP